MSELTCPPNSRMMEGNQTAVCTVAFTEELNISYFQVFLQTVQRDEKNRFRFYNNALSRSSSSARSISHHKLCLEAITNIYRAWIGVCVVVVALVVIINTAKTSGMADISLIFPLMGIVCCCSKP